MINKDYFAHETACIEDDCTIGEGTKIWHFSHIMKGSVIGRQCNIGQNVVVSPGAVLGDGVKVQNNVSVYTGVICEDSVFLGPSCVFTNVINPRAFLSRKDEFHRTLVRHGASIGANVTIVCGCTIEKFAMIGAGAVVTKDVPDYALVYGVPSRIHGYVCECGEQIVFSGQAAVCGACGKRYQMKGTEVEEMSCNGHERRTDSENQ